MLPAPTVLQDYLTLTSTVVYTDLCAATTVHLCARSLSCVQTPYPWVEQQWLAAQWRRLEAERAARAAGASGSFPGSPTAGGDAPPSTQVALVSERFSMPGGERLSEAGAAVQAGAGKAKSFLKAGMRKGVAAVRARMAGAEGDDANVRWPPLFHACTTCILYTMYTYGTRVAHVWCMAFMLVWALAS